MQNFNTTGGMAMNAAVAGGAMSAAAASNPNDDIPWWLRYAGRGVGAGGGILVMAMGIWTCITLSPVCVVAGIWLVMAGFLLTALEAPCCCLFIDFVQQFSNWADARPFWQKAAAYLALSLPSIILCRSMASIFGSCLIFLTAALYGLMALGKKANRTEMLSRAHSTSDMMLVDDRGQPRDVEAGKSIPRM